MISQLQHENFKTQEGHNKILSKYDTFVFIVYACSTRCVQKSEALSPLVCSCYLSLNLG